MFFDSKISLSVNDRLNFFNALEKAVVLIDQNFEIKASNEIFANLYAESEKSLLQFVCPDDWQSCKAQLQKLFRNETCTVKTEKRFKNKNGNYVWSNVIATQWETDETGSYIFLLFDDVSILKNTQKQLADSEIKYSGLIENLPVAVFYIDLEDSNPKVYFSKQFETIFHISSGTLDQNLLELRRYVHPDDLQVFNHTHNQYDSNNKLLVTEYRLINDLNETFWVRERACLIRSNGNKIIRIYGVMMDITGEKKNWQQFRQTELKYQALIESANDRICVLDDQGQIVYSNSYFFGSLGLHEEYNSNNFLQFFHPKDKEKHKKAFRKVLKTGSASYEYRLKSQKGHYLYMHNKLSLLKDETDNIEGILSINRDITRMKKIEKDLIDARKKAEESDLLKSSFLANMSHEIRTPLNGIIGFSKLLSNSEIAEEKRELYYDIIDRNSQQLLSLISDIIDLAKIESDQLTISPAEMNLNELLEETYQLFLNELKSHPGKNIKLFVSADLEKEHAFIIADRHRLAQLYNNLLSNAIKFTESGSIEFGYRYSGKDFLFYVKDTGAGILEKYQNIIFEPFRQEDETITREFGGTGLGLSICKKLVHLMGGKLWMESEKGTGSIFHFLLQLPFSQKSNPLLPPGSVQEDWQGKTILIVDDNKDVLIYLREILSNSQAKVITAESGKEAIDICSWGEKIDLVLLDIQMPRMDGYSTAKGLLKRHPQLPIIAQTAHAMSGDNEKCNEAGFSGYITKPIDKIKLKRLISSLLS